MLVHLPNTHTPNGFEIANFSHLMEEQGYILGRWKCSFRTGWTQLYFIKLVFSLLFYLACGSLTAQDLTDYLGFMWKEHFIYNGKPSCPVVCPYFTLWNLCGTLVSLMGPIDARKMEKQKPALPPPKKKDRQSCCLDNYLPVCAHISSWQHHEQEKRGLSSLGTGMAIHALKDSNIFPFPGSGAGKISRLHVSRKQGD